MFRTRAARALLIPVMVASASVGTLAFASASGAAVKPDPFTGVKCTTLTGNVNSTATLSGCNGNTGGSSMALAGAAFASGGTITWTNSLTTTLNAPTVANGTFTCPKHYKPYKASGTVAADTTGSVPVGSTYKINVCLDSKSGALTNSGKVKI